MLIGWSPYSEMLSNHKERNAKFIVVMMEAMQVKLLLLVEKLSETEIYQIFCNFTKISVVNCSSLANSEILNNQ